MTFSLLARDERTGTFGGVAATGNLCVGGWVLRGDARGGITASQGLSPSFLWGEDALAALLDGAGAEAAVSATVRDDPGRDARQLAALTASGAPAAFDGAGNHPFTGHLSGPDWIATGNWLSGPEVIRRAAEALAASRGAFEARLLDALEAGVVAGSDRRGTQSAALLVVGADRTPQSLRIDDDPDPVARLRALHDKTCQAEYQAWLATLPTRNAPEKA